MMFDYVSINNEQARIETSLSHHKTMLYIVRRLGAANSIVSDPIWQKFELMQGTCIVNVFVTSNFKKEQIDSCRERWRHQFLRSRAAYSKVIGGIWPKLKLIQAFMYVLVTCKYEKGPIKTAEKNVMTSFSPM